MDNLREKSVGNIVADNFAAADVFSRYGIDFCCHGSMSLEDACKKAGANIEEVIQAVKASAILDSDTHIPNFKDWPIDLLADYILKIYHRGIRREAPKIRELMNKVCSVHGEAHPSLYEVQELFNVSVMDLYHHLEKEEMVLFPYIYNMADAELNDTPLAPMHCGSIANPIEVMKMEHEAEGVRYENIATLTGNYSTPEDGCDSYRLLMDKLRDFNRHLHEHIHLENNILFPKAIDLERRLASR